MAVGAAAWPAWMSHSELFRHDSAHDSLPTRASKVAIITQYINDRPVAYKLGVLCHRRLHHHSELHLPDDCNQVRMKYVDAHAAMHAVVDMPQAMSFLSECQTNKYGLLCVPYPMWI